MPNWSPCIKSEISLKRCSIWIFERDKNSSYETPLPVINRWRQRLQGAARVNPSVIGLIRECSALSVNSITLPKQMSTKCRLFFPNRLRSHVTLITGIFVTYRLTRAFLHLILHVFIYPYTSFSRALFVCVNHRPATWALFYPSFWGVEKKLHVFSNKHFSLII